MALKLSKHCRQRYTYGICECCDKCGYMTREDMYDDVKESSHRLYEKSKENAEKAKELLNNIDNLNSNCKEIMQVIKDYNAEFGNMIKFSIKVKSLSKIAKKLSILLEKLMKSIEEVDKLADTIENTIDF